VVAVWQTGSGCATALSLLCTCHISPCLVFSPPLVPVFRWIQQIRYPRVKTKPTEDLPVFVPAGGKAGVDPRAATRRDVDLAVPAVGGPTRVRWMKSAVEVSLCICACLCAVLHPLPQVVTP
jgi:hypothetical protein